MIARNGEGVRGRFRTRIFCIIMLARELPPLWEREKERERDMRPSVGRAETRGKSGGFILITLITFPAYRKKFERFMFLASKQCCAGLAIHFSLDEDLKRYHRGSSNVKVDKCNFIVSAFQFTALTELIILSWWQLNNLFGFVGQFITWRIMMI